MNYTTHKRLQKPISMERYNIEVFNTNANIIDSELNKHDLKDNELERQIENHTHLTITDAEIDAIFEES